MRLSPQAVGKRALVSLFCLFLRVFRVSCFVFRVCVVVMMMSSLAQTSRYIVDVENSKIFVTKSVSRKRARDEEDDDIDADKSLQILLVVPS